MEIFRSNPAVCSEYSNHERCLRPSQPMGIMKFVPLFSTLGTSLLRKRRKASLISGRCCVPDISRQRANNPVDVFANLLVSKPDDVKDCLVLVELMMTLSPSTARCARRFSAMNQLKSNVRTRISQGSLVVLMRVRSSDVSTKKYYCGPAISHWILDAKAKRHTVKSD